MKAPAYCNETERLATLYRYDILDTPDERAFDDLTRLAASICNAPIAVVNLIDRDRQWFKSEIGLGVKETPLDSSLCAHAILQPGLFIVPDTTKDARFSDNPLVTGNPLLRFYAGALLESSDGYPIRNVVRPRLPAPRTDRRAERRPDHSGPTGDGADRTAAQRLRNAGFERATATGNDRGASPD